MVAWISEKIVVEFEFEAWVVVVAFTASCSNEVVRGVKVAIVVLFELKVVLSELKVVFFELKVVLFELNEVPGKSLEKVVSTDSSWFKVVIEVAGSFPSRRDFIVVIEVSASSVDGSLSPTS